MDLAPRGAITAKFSNGFKISFKICLIFKVIFKFFLKKINFLKFAFKIYFEIFTFLKFAFNFFYFLSLKFIVADLALRRAKTAKFSNGFKISFKICLIFIFFKKKLNFLKFA